VDETSEIKISFQSKLNRRIDNEIEAALYRAVIECINNTLKHAKAKNITIDLEDTDSKLYLQYRDDGEGYDHAKILSERKGLGLFNLQNRIQSIGGRIKMTSIPGNGVDYQITVALFDK
jgi:signal transduction histidine kinase